ncbi:MAG: hypothetical protein ACRDIC_19615 [bacterium]
MTGSAPSQDPSEPRRPRILQALLQDFNLIGLGGVAALAVLTGSPIPLIVGGAVEALYLINAPGSRWFERYLALQRARHRGQRREAWRQRTLTALPRAERERFHATQHRLAGARDSLNQETRLLAHAELDRVEDLLDQILDLLHVRAAAKAHLSTIDSGALGQEMEDVRRRIKETDHPGLIRVEEQRLEVLVKRLEEYRQMKRSLQIVTSQISTLEHSIAYLADKLVSWNAAGREPQGLKEILAGVESTEQAMNQVRPVIEQIHRTREA